MEATVTSKGQVTIPIWIRTKAKISSGARLDFQIKEDGVLTVSVINQEVSQLRGMIKSKKNKPVSLKEMKNAIHDSSKRAMK